MRYAILSDIHSNLESLLAVLKTFPNESIEKCYCLGDVVGYGANPNECIKEIRNAAAMTLAGNHDWASAGLFPVDYFVDYAKEAIVWTRGVLTSASKSFLESLKLVFEDQSMTMVHGTLNNPGDFNYMFNSGVARESFELLNTQICFVGHTHVAGVFVQDEAGRVSFGAGPHVKLEPGRKYIVNAGSVGQPRDNNPKAAYCIFDDRSKTIEIKRVAYDLNAVQAKILNAGMPRFLASRIAVGQ
jgi:predicted phosphodiesterase